MIRKNIYSRITESIIQAHRDTTLDSALESDGSENIGKKIVAIITADPDQDLDWESEYEPFGATELTTDDEQEAMEHEGMESDHELCPSCGYDVDCDGDECEDDSEWEDDEWGEQAGEVEEPVIGSGFSDDYENAEIKDILIDILDELRGDDSEEDDDFESSEENSMFDDSDDDDEDEDVDSMLEPKDDWASEESDEQDGDDDEQDDFDEEEDFEIPADEDGLEIEDLN